MRDDEKGQGANSHTGWWIGAGVFMLLFYFLIPPFIFKGLLICGMNHHDANEIMETIFFPIIYMHENEFPGVEFLGQYYGACKNLLGY